MKNIVVLILFCITILTAAEPHLLAYNGFTGKITRGDFKISKEQLKSHLSFDSTALEEYNTWRFCTVFGMVNAVVGGFCLGKIIGSNMAADKYGYHYEAPPELTITAVTAITAGFAIDIYGTVRIKKGIEIYNSRYSLKDAIPTSLTVSPQRLSLVWNF